MNAPARQTGYAISTHEIERLLRASVEALVTELLPNAKREMNRFLVIGSLAGEPGQSLKINLQGANRGMWTDFSVATGSGYQGGDCLHLVREVLFRGDMVQAIKWAKSWLGIDGMDPARLETWRAEAKASAERAELDALALTEKKRKRAVAMWLGARPIAGTPAEAYLRGRGIDPEALGRWPGSLRFHAEIWNSELRLKIPAMLAQMVTPEGKHVATHRTYLAPGARGGWTKIDSPNAKMVLGQCRGSFIPLRKGASGKSMTDMPEGESFYITEGIEDGLVAAVARPSLRIGAGYSLPNIGSIDWPERLGSLVMLCDRDEAGSPAVDALERVVARQQAKGVRVQFVMPPRPFKDLNDWLRGVVAPMGEEE